MLAVLKRELRSYFCSPVAYVYIAVFAFFSGLYFWSTTLAGRIADLSYVFNSMFMVCTFLIPVLTMRLISEDRKNKTDQALLTAPISLLELVMGKYLAALCMFVIGLLEMVVFGVVISFLGQPQWSMILGHLIGLFLLGAALIAVGMFISALTENQIIAAVGGFTVGILLNLLDVFSDMVHSPLLGRLFDALSFNNHYLKFTQGLLDFTDILFFVSVCVVFIFLTLRAFERRRWC